MCIAHSSQNIAGLDSCKAIKHKVNVFPLSVPAVIAVSTFYSSRQVSKYSALDALQIKTCLMQ